MAKQLKDQMAFPTNNKGKPVDPFTGELLVPVEELLKAEGQIPKRMSKEEADRIRAERIARGDLRFIDACRTTGMATTTMHKKLAQIKPDQYYLPDGSSPTGQTGEKLVLGSDLIFRHNYSIYISRELVEGIKKKTQGKTNESEQSASISPEEADLILAECLKRGDMTLQKAADYIGITKRTLQTRLREIESQEVWTPSERADEIIIKPSSLIFRHPHPNKGVYIRKELVEEIRKLYHPTPKIDNATEVKLSDKVIEEPEEKLQEKPKKKHQEVLPLKVPGDDWRSRKELTGPRTLLWRELVNIEDEFKKKEKAHTLTRKPIERGGHIIRAQRMRSGAHKSIYFHKDDVEFVKQVAGVIKGDFPNKIDGDGWVSRSHLVSRLHPSVKILMDDIEAEFKIKEQSGDQSPIVRNTIEIKAQRMLAGPVPTIFYEEASLSKAIESVLAQTDKKKLGRPKKDIQKTSPATKVGDVDESKLPENVRGQLDQKRKKQREK